MGVWGGDTRPIVTQKNTFHLDALTDRIARCAHVGRVVCARADDQCWICLDGDTEGREVRPSSRLRAREATTRCAERDARRRRSYHHHTHRATPLENARTRERNVSLDRHPFDSRLGTIGGGVWGGKSRFCGKYLAGDLSVLSMGVRVFTHMGDSMESVCGGIGFF